MRWGLAFSLQPRFRAALDAGERPGGANRM